MRRLPSTDGVEVAVHDLGGDGPPVVFAHATGFHGLVWAPLAGHLTDRYRCWSLDFRGHGDSVAPDDHLFDWHGFADDVLAVIDGLGLDRPLAVGHSKGGAALLLAEEDRPGLFRAIYCYEPIVFPGDAPPGPMTENPLAQGARRRREVFPSADAAYENYASKPPLSALHPAALRAYVDHGFAEQPDGTVRLKCRGEHEARVYTMGSAHGAYARLPEIGCPVTIATGSDAAGGPAAFAPLLAERIPGARLARHDDLGHFGPLEDPAAIAAEVAGFFARAAGA
ncbi:MAG: alpha/beta hydrolase [Acidimicrobiales bacterium]|nr:alpha/beta hydrolase [Acidimicrobiales bacterium]